MRRAEGTRLWSEWSLVDVDWLLLLLQEVDHDAILQEPNKKFAKKNAGKKKVQNWIPLLYRTRICSRSMSCWLD